MISIKSVWSSIWTIIITMSSVIDLFFKFQENANIDYFVNIQYFVAC